MYKILSRPSIANSKRRKARGVVFGRFICRHPLEFLMKRRYRGWTGSFTKLKLDSWKRVLFAFMQSNAKCKRNISIRHRIIVMHIPCTVCLSRWSSKNVVINQGSIKANVRLAFDTLDTYENLSNCLQFWASRVCIVVLFKLRTVRWFQNWPEKTGVLCMICHQPWFFGHEIHILGLVRMDMWIWYRPTQSPAIHLHLWFICKKLLGGLAHSTYK